MDQRKLNKRVLTKDQINDIRKAERAHDYFMNVEQNAGDYIAYILVESQSAEFASRVLNTPLTD